MTSSGGGSKGFQQVNSCVKVEYQGDVNGFVGIEPGSQGDDEPRTRKIDENVQDQCNQVTLQENAATQAPQQQLQGSLVHWERFLHVRSIKVMLVEDDDCTRHIVTALLRNCNYEVIVAANGFQAWKILENLSNHIDIVLTEVVMPCLSGIGLLCKIMSHKTRKNIPVIMMSSHDSMGLVFKCLSKGAVDFLVKPVRKNELKNLWQHVWRRCHSSSGSGSESGTQAQKSVNSKSNLRYNNGGDKDGNDNGSTSGGSDDGSGTQWANQARTSKMLRTSQNQSERIVSSKAKIYGIVSQCETYGHSSWTKQAVEPESPEAASPSDQIAEHPDSTCGLVIRSVHTQTTRESNDPEGRPYNDGKAKEIADCRFRNSQMQIEFPIQAPIKHHVIEQNTHQAFDPTLNVKSKDKGISDIRREHSLNKQKAKDSKMPETYMENGEPEGQGEPEKIMDANTNDSNGVIVGELGLKRPRADKHSGTEVQNGCNILRHSELSAFTRYKTASNAVKGTPGITAGRSQPDYRPNDVKKESKRDARSDGYLIYQGSSEKVLPRKADGIPPAGVLHQEHRIQHIYHHHHVHHYHNLDEEQQLSNHDDFGLNKLGADAPYCGSSNIVGGPVEGNIENYSLNRSASGSKHGSNVPNGSIAAVNFEATNVESDVGLVRSGSGDASGSGSGTRIRIDRHNSAQREAALTKFRQKREVRCFQKKVRYQNRKKLAEQRPRVRGQFVKGSGRDSSSNAAGD